MALLLRRGESIVLVSALPIPVTWTEVSPVEQPSSFATDYQSPHQNSAVEDQTCYWYSKCLWSQNLRAANCGEHRPLHYPNFGERLHQIIPRCLMPTPGWDCVYPSGRLIQ
ncbi:hypothetical protein BDR22DRAFT_362795 [Usnea florida]